MGERTEEADMPLVGIGHLTMLDTAPPDWVSLAHDAGFDAVGIRAAAIGPTEEEWPMRVGSPMLAETLRRMDDTGVRVLDAELVRIDPQTAVARYGPLFETAAALGASFINVMADDPDLHRATDPVTRSRLATNSPNDSAWPGKRQHAPTSGSSDRAT
jgi:hypothetical protein